FDVVNQGGNKNAQPTIYAWAEFSKEPYLIYFELFPNQLTLGILSLSTSYDTHRRYSLSVLLQSCLD
ncbi:MAG: hypothetical protein AABZ61_11630, partial [Bacteroidota bacterium]